MRDVAKGNPHAEVLIRAIRFNSGADWVVPQPTNVMTFQWTDMTASGSTSLGKALEKVADELDPERMKARGFPPVLALITDGHPTDDYKAGIKKVLGTPWGKRAIRVAIAIGDDANKSVCEQFINNVEIPVIDVHNPEALKQYIRFVSTAVLKEASTPATQSSGGGTSHTIAAGIDNVKNNAKADVDDVW